jgi:hypothetical protein
LNQITPILRGSETIIFKNKKLCLDLGFKATEAFQGAKKTLTLENAELEFLWKGVQSMKKSRIFFFNASRKQPTSDF